MSHDEIIRELAQAEKAGGEVRVDLEALSKERDPTIDNPKNIPLDFDGKPIPYWLYKFRQLNRTFVCEICCGAEYRGRSAAAAAPTMASRISLAQP